MTGSCAKVRCEAPAVGRALCDRHHEKRRLIAQAYKQRKVAAGICLSCTRPVDVGVLQCPHHRAAHIRYESENHAAKIRRRYGIDYGKWLAAQNGVCAICSKPETSRGSQGALKRLAVDHNHETGEVRGLLCNNCNRAIGFFADDSALVRRAADYLEGLI